MRLELTEDCQKDDTPAGSETAGEAPPLATGKRGSGAKAEGATAGAPSAPDRAGEVAL
jgi:hypothetical protein